MITKKIIAVIVPEVPVDIQSPNQPIRSDSSSNSKTKGEGLPRNSIIGICVGVGISVYAASTIAGIKFYRRYKSKKEKIMKEQHIMFADSISSPIMQGNSLGWVPAPYQNQHNHTH